MRHAIVASFVQLGLVGGVAGCGYSTLDQLPPREVEDFPVTASRDLDLLFLIDDSPGGEYQTSLADNFPHLIDVLSSIPGGLPNVHIGVATSDMGTQAEDGAPPGLAIGTQGQGGCSGLGKNGALQLNGAPVSGGSFVSDILDPATGMRQRNYTGTLVDVFSEMAHAGYGGCAFEQHLAAVKRALGNPTNAGFLRDTAYLGVIILSQEDDCSIQHSSLLSDNAAATNTLGALQSFRCTRFGVLCDQGGQTTDAMNQAGIKNQCHPNDNSAYLAKVSDYVKFLKSLKSDPSKVIVAGIVGTIDPFEVELRPPRTAAQPIPALMHSCTYFAGDGRGQVADPAIRIKFFLDQFPNRSAFASVCQPDLSGALEQFGALFKTALGDPCIQGKLADVDPKTPGPQFECDVTVTDPVQGTQTLAQLPRCTPEDATATHQPCWHLATAPASCPSSDHVKFVVEGLSSLPGTAHVIASCAVQPPT